MNINCSVIARLTDYQSLIDFTKITEPRNYIVPGRSIPRQIIQSYKRGGTDPTLRINRDQVRERERKKTEEFSKALEFFRKIKRLFVFFSTLLDDLIGLITFSQVHRERLENDNQTRETRFEDNRWPETHVS